MLLLRALDRLEKVVFDSSELTKLVHSGFLLSRDS